jgi:glycine cleavage system H protein
MKYAILPCNGLDKPAGPLARETALWQVAHDGSELVCPVLLSNSPDRYARVLGELPLVVIDGCATRCATKLANRLELKISRKVQIAEELKRMGATLGQSLALSPDDLAVARQIAASLTDEPAPAEEGATDFVLPQDYLEVAHDKFVFKIPATGFVFNENDVWAQLSACGRRARIGISDFAQQQLTDITFVGLPAIGAEVQQFGEAGYVESAKATLELVCPVSGRVVAVNTTVSETSELVNQEPYGAGWIAELELMDFSADRELLLDGAGYAEVVRGKAAEYS